MATPIGSLGLGFRKQRTRSFCFNVIISCSFPSNMFSSYFRFNLLCTGIFFFQTNLFLRNVLNIVFRLLTPFHHSMSVSLGSSSSVSSDLLYKTVQFFFFFFNQEKTMCCPLLSLLSITLLYFSFRNQPNFALFFASRTGKLSRNKFSRNSDHSSAKVTVFRNSLTRLVYYNLSPCNTFIVFIVRNVLPSDDNLFQHFCDIGILV